MNRNTRGLARAQAIAGRWISILACAAVAAAIWLVLEALFLSQLAAVADLLAQLGLWPLVVIASIIALFLIWPAARGRWRGWLSLRHLHAFPPLWISMLLGAAAVEAARFSLPTSALSAPRFDPLSYLFALIPLAVVAVVALLALAMSLREQYLETKERREKATAKTHSRDTAASPEKPITPGEKLRDFDGIVDWLRKDDPISQEDSDVFGHSIVARNMAERLLSAASGNTGPPSQMLIGELGSGKTTIANLVKKQIERDSARGRRIAFIQLSAWPFETPQALVTAILRELISALSKHVNTLSLTGLPRRYISTIEHAAGRFAFLAPLLDADAEPETILKRINAMALAIDLRLCLWIEDLERFAGEDVAGESSAHERLSPIRALLYSLDKQSRIAVIIADTRIKTYFDAEKLARHIEYCPKLHPIDTWGVIRTFRNGCLDSERYQFIDPVDKEHRSDWAQPIEGRIDPVWFGMFAGDPQPRDAVVYLLSTPRILKQSLRRTLDVWKKLYGEIDYDHLLITSIILVTQPDLYSHLQTEIQRFRSGLNDDRPGGDRPGPDERLRQELDKIGINDPVRPYVVALMRFLFPSLPVHTSTVRALDTPQGISVKAHCDYWDRLVGREQVTAELSDQAALRAIDDWKAGQESDLPQRLCDARRWMQITNFARRFSRDEVIRLLDEVIDETLRRPVADRSGHDEPIGLYAIALLMKDRRPDKTAAVAAIKKQLHKAFQSHLSLAASIEHLLGCARERTYGSYLEHEQRAEIRREIEHLLVTTFPPDAADALVEQCRAAPHAMLYWLVWGTDRLGKSALQNALPFEDWPQLASTMLRAAEIDATAILSQFPPFLCDEHFSFEVDDDRRPQAHHAASFDDERARRFFGDDGVQRLFTLFRKHPPPDDLPGDSDVRAMYEAVRSAAGGKTD